MSGLVPEHPRLHGREPRKVFLGNADFPAGVC
jgi:hypothetical protein